MVLALESWRRAQISYVRSCCTSSLSAWARKEKTVLWKTSGLVWAPKKCHPSAANDYRPVMPASSVMKLLERWLLTHLNKQTDSFQDPACTSSWGWAEDVVVIHLVQVCSTETFMSSGFSSPFNTIQLALLCGEQPHWCLNVHLAVLTISVLFSVTPSWHDALLN